MREGRVTSEKRAPSPLMLPIKDNCVLFLFWPYMLFK